MNHRVEACSIPERIPRTRGTVVGLTSAVVTLVAEILETETFNHS